MIEEKQTIEPRIQLRSAENSDTGFLAALYASTRSDELAQLGWTPEQQTAFCQLQFRLQNEAYKMQFPDAVNSIIEFEGKACGRLLVSRTETEIRLIDIALLPEYRGCGAGSVVIRDLQREAEIAGKPLNLRVLTTNTAAFRLYEKLGFEVVESSQTHFSMQWQPKPQDLSKE